MGLLHEEHTDSEGRLVLFRCAECDATYLSMGSLHAHVESHWTVLGSLWWRVTHIVRSDAARKWMQYTIVLAVDDVESIPLDEVDA